MKKRVLSLLLTLVMMVSLLPNAFAAKTATFTDVPEDMWCFDYVEYVAEYGYFKGTTATTFNPNGTMTRQQFVTVLARMAGVKVDNSKTAFSDVPAGSYSAGSVAWAAKAGIVTGYADGTFHPTAPVTRQQMCAFMSRFMDYYADAYSVRFLKRPTVSTFADYNQVADYAKTAVDRCRAYGLVQGYAADNTFRPANSATRAHVAAVIYRLALIIKQVGGGTGTGPNVPGPGPGPGPGPNPPVPVTYTLTYTSNPLGTVATKNDTQTNTAGSATFNIKGIDFVHANAAEYAGKGFTGWKDDVDPSIVYHPDGENKTVTLTSATPKVLTAKWVDLNDLLYWAIRDSAAEALGKANTMTGKVDAEVPYAALTSLTVETPDDVDDNGTAITDDDSRTVTIAAAGELDTDIISRLVETATHYAVNMIGTPAKFVDGSDADKASEYDAITKAEVREIVSELLDLIDPNMTWWEGEGRREKIEKLASKVYDSLKAKAKEGKGYAGLLWNSYYKYPADATGAVLFTEVDLVDGNGSVVVTAKADKKLYDAADNQLSYKKGVAKVAKAIAKELYADLKTHTNYVYDLALSGKLTLNFTMNPAQDIAVKTAPYPKTYHVEASLDLKQIPDVYNGQDQYYLAYKFENGRPYVKLIINALMQAEYEDSVNALAEAAMTNATARQTLKDTVIGRLDAMIDSMPDLVNKLVAYNEGIPGDQSTPAAARAYLKGKLTAGVENWIEENLSTEPTPTDATGYRPFDFFWNRDGKVDANGNITSVITLFSGTNPDHVFINDDLTSVINNMVDEVFVAVLDEDYGIVLGANESLTDGVKRVIDTKIEEKVDKDDIQNDIETLAKTKIIEGLNEAASSSGFMGAYLSTKVAEFFEDAFGCTITNPSTSPDVTGLTVEGIDTFLSTTYDISDDTDPYYSRNKSFVDLQVTLRTEIEDKLNTSMSSVLVGNIANIIDGDAEATVYLKNKVLAYVGFDGHAAANYPVANEEDVIENLVNSVKASALEGLIGEQDEDDDRPVEEILAEKVDTALSNATGAFSKYLNQIGVAKTFDGMFDKAQGVTVNRLVELMKHPKVLNKLTDKAPRYVEAIAKAITKIEDNASSITINGVTVNNDSDIVDDVKGADDARELYLAVADFLAQWGTMTLADFTDDDGVAVDVVASAKGYTYNAGANFVIEVADYTPVAP